MHTPCLQKKFPHASAHTHTHQHTSQTLLKEGTYPPHSSASAPAPAPRTTIDIPVEMPMPTMGVPSFVLDMLSEHAELEEATSGSMWVTLVARRVNCWSFLSKNIRIFGNVLLVAGSGCGSPSHCVHAG